nr:MAG TPA: hypothetical protein [Caudoviricetes sp.]DAZ34033.1 MAG TPA: hypothetical protein [Caudoviricetes sp.]
MAISHFWLILTFYYYMELFRDDYVKNIKEHRYAVQTIHLSMKDSGEIFILL